MKTIRNLLTLAFASMLMLTGYAQQGPRSERGPREGQWMDRLELTDAQKAQIDELRKTQQSTMQDVRAQLNIKEAELDAAMLKENSKAVKTLVASINDLRGQLFANQIDHRMAVRGLLTDDQKFQFDQFAGKQRRMKQKAGGPGNDMHPPHGHGRAPRSGGN